MKGKFEMKISVVTPCSRPENIELLYKSINFPCEWYIVCDMEPNEAFLKLLLFAKGKEWIHVHRIKGGVSGNLQRNYALDLIKDSWVYFLDDDNLFDPDFYSVVQDIVEKDSKVGCIFFSQAVNSNKINLRTVDEKSVKVGKIDQAQFIIHTDLIGRERYLQKYEADGIFIENIFTSNPLFRFRFYNSKPVTYYNKIR